MRIDNLVFNKIGNSISVMVFSEDGNLQLWDETDFLYKSISVSLKGLCAKEFLEFYLEFTTNNRKFNVVLNLNDKNGFLKVDNYNFPVEVGEEEIIIKINIPDLAFKLAFSKLEKIQLEGEIVKVKEKDFLKGITEFLKFLLS